jgi:hypothetical protein
MAVAITVNLTERQREFSNGFSAELDRVFIAVGFNTHMSAALVLLVARD